MPVQNSEPILVSIGGPKTSHHMRANAKSCNSITVDFCVLFSECNLAAIILSYIVSPFTNNWRVEASLTSISFWSLELSITKLPYSFKRNCFKNGARKTSLEIILGAIYISFPLSALSRSCRLIEESSAKLNI